MTFKPTVRTTLGATGMAVAAAWFAMSPPTPVSASGARPDPYANLPASLQLTGVVRDFRAANVTGGHADFERTPTRGYGHYANQVADQLDSDAKPVFFSTGKKVTTEFRDAQNRNIMQPRLYIGARTGDRAGVLETQDGGSITTATNFQGWFRDTPGVNLSRPLSLSLIRQANTNVYTFTDSTDPLYRTRGGFFPINGELFGNSGLTPANTNLHFTYELETSFVYRRGGGQVFTFTGDDDVYVFIDGKMVIDLGGVHSAVSQTIDLDRLTWLTDGRRYPLKFFFAERHSTQSNFRIDTTINLENAQLPTTAPLYD